MQDGIFLVIEGSDGSGKTTQYKLLLERLKSEGYTVHEIKFPRYEEESSYFVRKYLKGDYGEANELGPYTPSLFYALDRFDAGPQIRQWLASGHIVLADRYIAANKAHQGQKIDDSQVRHEYYNWLDQLEFTMLAIPKPDLNIVLTLPYETAIELIKKRGEAQEVDIHDGDPEHLRRATATYIELCQLYPTDFTHVDCTKDGELLSIPSINNLIWERITPMLKKLRKQSIPAPAKTAEQVFAPKPTNNPYITKNKNKSYSITPDGKKFLQNAVTNTTDNVYMFTDKLSATTVAAAMARLSRRGDDMRVTLLDEFSQVDGKDEGLLRRVITAFGDDSVQQLTGVHFVVENASNLLTKKLEWGRLAAYLEQSTRYIFFDQKDENGKFKYFTPTTLDEDMTRLYDKQMETLFERYSELVHKLTEFVRSNSKEPVEKRDGAWKAATRAQACDAARPVLPVATTATVGIFASGQALESLIMHLESDEFKESNDTATALLAEGRKIIPTFLERADKPDRGGAWVAYRAQTRAKMKQIAHEKHLQPIKGNGDSAVVLTDVWPRNEFALLPHMLYEQSTLSLAELEKALDEWSYEEKATVYQAYMGERLNRRHKPGRALEIAHYSFDLICDYGIFRDLQRHRMVDSLEWQALSPHYGYEIPKLVSDADAEDLFEACFDQSMELYQILQNSGYELEAQYGTLLGHKMRWKLTLNAREAFHFMELRTSPQGHPGYRKLAKEMYDAIATVHPLIAQNMIFVNQGEDAELTRLAAERATQFKLDQLN